MIADLHVHSHYSDGADSMEEVLKKAREQHVTHLSFVDHDTVAGLAEAKVLGEAYDMTIIPGIEISAFDFKRNRKVHVLGYDYVLQSSHIQELCQPVLERRHAHSLWQIDQIRKSGIELNPDEILASVMPGKVIYKQHIMRQLTDAPYHSSEYKNLYQSLFKGDGVAAGDIIYADVFDAIRAIKADGGLAVIAHPGQLDSYDLIPELVPIGLDGIELYHPDHTQTDHQKIQTLSQHHNLITTGGTDYHGAFGPPSQPGDLSKFVGDRHPFCPPFVK
ncbi:PHP domain-containing protein [Cytobacillus purgationiresistens]|uniref:Metal-dependent phosphoesterase TrpH n=1 Tax=Cytobacillus purgationiresistens TaxID=863449 RepID=A0ABU0AKP8_9BACI|nr:PHP domain-containing protein [Cytobacillus purgationiresistens]MDQ0271838.1 putative metal-dependent phosphoesterase TrpH [Cytobacillus purgationiresistens]